MSQTLLEKYPNLRALLENKEKPAPTTVKEDSSTSRKEMRKRSRGPQPPPPAGVTAEQLFADSVEADEAEWLVFHIKEPGWRSKQLGDLKNWLEQNKPSKVRRADGIGWISVISAAEEDLSVRELTAQLEVEGDAKSEWETLGQERNMETVNRLAEKFNYRMGKWLLHISSEWVDKIWSRLAVAMLRGDISPDTISSIKVSPRSPPTEHGSSHVVVIHNPDYQDTAQVMKAESELRSAGVLGDLYYKPDVFSHLGIYRNNVWGFRPSIYMSRMARNEKKSKCYMNSSKGLEIPDLQDLTKIVADIQTSEPDFIADYDPNQYDEEEEEN